MCSMHQELLREIKPADLQEFEDNQLSRWHEAGCQNFPNCVSGQCNPGCDLEQTFGDGVQWGAG